MQGFGSRRARTPPPLYEALAADSEPESEPEISIPPVEGADPLHGKRLLLPTGGRRLDRPGRRGRAAPGSPLAGGHYAASEAEVPDAAPGVALQGEPAASDGDGERTPWLADGQSAGPSVLADKFERPMPGNAVQGAKARPKKWVIASVLVAALALGFVVVKVAAVWLAPDPLRIPGEKAVSAVALGEDGLPRGYTYARGADGEPVKVPCGPVSVVLVPGEAVPEAAGEVVDQTVSLAAEMSGLYLQESESVGDGVALVQFEFVPFEAIVQRVGYGTAETIGVTLTGYDPEGMLVSTILIDRSYFDYAWPKDPDGVVFSILHQMGHALGLGDSTNAGSLMYPDRLKDSRVTAPDVAAFAALVPKCG